jgi:hypothetical protein
MLSLLRQEAGKHAAATSYFQCIAAMLRYLSQKEAMVMVIMIPTPASEQGKPVKISLNSSHIDCFCHGFSMRDDQN